MTTLNNIYSTAEQNLHKIEDKDQKNAILEKYFFYK